MSQEEYNQLSYDYEHCAGTHCEKASQCLRHTAYTMLESGGRERYMMLNPKVVTGAQPCSYYEQKRKKRFAWGISRIVSIQNSPSCHFTKNPYMTGFI